MNKTIFKKGLIYAVTFMIMLTAMFFVYHVAASKVKVKLKKTAYTYSGKVIKPKVTSVKFKNKSIKKKKYSISYQIKKNGKWKTIKAKKIKKVGTYRVVVTYKKKGKKYKGYSTFKIKKKAANSSENNKQDNDDKDNTTEKTNPTPSPTPTPTNEKKYDVYEPSFICSYEWIGAEGDDDEYANQSVAGCRLQNTVTCNYCGKVYKDVFKSGSGNIVYDGEVDSNSNLIPKIDGATVELTQTALQNFYAYDKCGHTIYTESELNEEVSTGWADEPPVQRKQLIINNSYCFEKKWVKKYKCFCSKQFDTFTEQHNHVLSCTTYTGKDHADCIEVQILDKQVYPTFTEIK